MLVVMKGNWKHRGGYVFQRCHKNFEKKGLHEVLSTGPVTIAAFEDNEQMPLLQIFLFSTKI